MKKQLISTTTVILLVVLFMNVVNGIPEKELDMAITSLKANGYNLFGNAISTSDIRYQIITTITNNITLFAPTDSDLYSLDLVSDSSDYVQKLRYHISLNQFSSNNLSSSSSSSSNLGGSNNQVSYINTLIPHHCLTITIDKGNPNEKYSSFVSVDGVRIVVPDLYTGSRITVHGLSGILSVNFRKNVNENVYSDLDLGSISSSTQSIQCFSSYVPPVNFPDPVAMSTTSFSPPSPDSLTVPIITQPPPSTQTVLPYSVSVWVTSSIPDTTTASLSIPASTPAASVVASPGAIPSPIPVSLPVFSPPPVPTAEILPVKLKGNTDELDLGNKRDRGLRYRSHHHHHHLHHQHRHTKINAQKKFHRIRRIYDHHHEDFL